MKAWLDELVDGIYRGLFALIILFIPSLMLGELAKLIFPAEYDGWFFLGLLCAYFLLLYRLRYRLPYLRDEEPTDS
jgi:hypothetical protein